MKIFLALIIFLSTALSACKKIKLPWNRNQQTSQSEVRPPPITKTRLPFDPATNSTHVLDDWFSYLWQARLAFLPGLKITCQEGRNNLLIKYSFDSTANFDCFDLFTLNNLDSRWKCLSPTQLQYLLEENRSSARCENLVQFSELVRDIKLPSSKNLFVKDQNNSLFPLVLEAGIESQQSLPQILSKSTPDSTPEQVLTLNFPGPQEWLQSSFESGALALVLETDSKNIDPLIVDHSFFHLLRFIAQQKEPAQIRFFLNPATLSPPKKRDTAKVPFFTLKKDPNDLPLFADTCEYINRWLKSRQILAGLDPAENRVQSLSCRIRWAEKSLFSATSLTLVKLPLPLVFESPSGGNTFPFRNLQDVLSPGVFRSLKKP